MFVSRQVPGESRKRGEVEHAKSGNRKQTIALKSKKDIEAKYIDMELIELS